MSCSRDFHAALSDLYARGAGPEIRRLLALGGELLEAVEGELYDIPEDDDLPAARFSENLILEWINDAGAAIYGRAVEDLLGTPLPQLARACNLPTYIRCMQEVLRTRRPVHAHFRDNEGSAILAEYRPVPGRRAVLVRLDTTERNRKFSLAYPKELYVIE